MFFNQSEILIYIKRDSLELFSGTEMEGVEFSSDIVSNNEILDEVKYSKLVSLFLAKFNLKDQKVIIVLSPEIIFYKSFPLVEADQLDILVQKFTDTIPFEVEQIASKRVLTKQELWIFATSRKLYGLIAQRIMELGGELKAVLPLEIFKDSLKMEDDELNAELVKKILDNKQLIVLSNFLSYEEISLKGKQEQARFGIVFLVIMLLLFLTALIFAYFSGFLKLAFPNAAKSVPGAIKVKEEIKKVEESSVSAAEATGSASFKKEDLKIEILNGTGLPGQAAKVADQLSALGYSNFKMGNVTRAEATETAVVFSKNVSLEQQSEIEEEMKKSFSNVSKQDTSSSAEFDIIITTGQII